MTTAPVYLLTTSDLRRNRLADLRRLVASAQAALENGEIRQLRHIILLQSCSDVECTEIGARLPHSVKLLCTEGTLSSPSARNLLISHLMKQGDLHPQAFVGFPDDDAWYPSGALACVAQQFGESADLQLLLCRYGPTPSARECDKAFRPTLQQALTCGACAAIFVRARLVAQLGGFHQLLGLGTALSGGEDTEFVHRAFHQANGRSVCVPGVLVGHAACDPEKKMRYYEGALAAIMAHSDVSAAARIALLRKLAVGLSFVMRSRMPLSQYLRTVHKARDHVAALRRGPLASDTSERPPTAEIH